MNDKKWRSIKKLEKDILKKGVLEPLLVEMLFDGKYGVIDGNHRFQIALKHGFAELPCQTVTKPLKNKLYNEYLEYSKQPIRTLIMVTGNENNILKIWLPSLREQGKYEGDVLILDYYDSKGCYPIAEVKGFSREAVTYVKSLPNVLYYKRRRVIACIPNDRIRALYAILKKIGHNYDVVMITDGNDLEFLQDINPLFRMALTNFCYSTEDRNNSRMTFFKPVIATFPPETWDLVKDELIINAGVYTAPTHLMLKVFKQMIENMKWHSDKFGSEQHTLNILVHSETIPTRNVGATYNYVLYGGNKKTYSFENGVCYGRENGKPVEIAILHQVGYSSGKYNGKVRERTVNGALTDPVIKIAFIPNFLFPQERKGHKPNWLFKNKRK